MEYFRVPLSLFFQSSLGVKCVMVISIWILWLALKKGLKWIRKCLIAGERCDVRRSYSYARTRRRTPDMQATMQLRPQGSLLSWKFGPRGRDSRADQKDRGLWERNCGIICNLLKATLRAGTEIHDAEDEECSQINSVSGQWSQLLCGFCLKGCILALSRFHTWYFCVPIRPNSFGLDHTRPKITSRLTCLEIFLA